MIWTSVYPQRVRNFPRGLRCSGEGCTFRSRACHISIFADSIRRPGVETLGGKQSRSTSAAHRRPTATDFVSTKRFAAAGLIGPPAVALPVSRNEVPHDLQSASLASCKIVTLEHEIQCDWQEPDCHLWFFDHGLPVTLRYVPRSSGWLIVGVGGDRRAHEARRARNFRQTLGASGPRLLGARLAGPTTIPRLQLLLARACGRVVRRDNALHHRGPPALADRDWARGIGP